MTRDMTRETLAMTREDSDSRRRDTAMSMDVMSRRVSTEDIEMACRNAPEDGAADAIRRARLAGVWATDNTASAAISCRG